MKGNLVLELIGKKIIMAKARKEGNKRRNRKNLVKNLKRIQENNKILKSIKENK